MKDISFIFHRYIDNIHNYESVDTCFQQGGKIKMETSNLIFCYTTMTVVKILMSTN